MKKILFVGRMRCGLSSKTRTLGCYIGAVLLCGWGGLEGVRAQMDTDISLTGLTLVDDIDCGNASDPHLFAQSPASVSAIQTVLGVNTRVLPNPAGAGPAYFAYRVGQAKGLVAGKAYILVVDYPEDAARSMMICNHGEASVRGLYTGATLGDALHSPYTRNNAESLDMPLSGAVQQWKSYFHLHDRFSDLQRIHSTGTRPFVPVDGFWVVIARFANSDDPLSQGPAVSRIRLYEAPVYPATNLALNFPPDGLPRRHLFYREEMGDSNAGIINTDPLQRGAASSKSWFEYHARLLEFLGMNTFSKDLVEFGANQGFDSGPGGGSTWYAASNEPNRWEDILDMLQAHPALDVMPYYEYAGSEGAGGTGLGPQKRPHPLQANVNDYTHVTWAEASRADLLDPDTDADAKLLLDVTMTRFKDKARFLGAWIRPRQSSLPMSFNAANLVQFSNEVLGGYPVAREHLLAGGSLYQQYKAWWFGKRKSFINSMRDHLRNQGIADASILYTTDPTEPGLSNGTPELVAETAGPWSALSIPSVTPAAALSARRHFLAITTPYPTYSYWEWQHSVPEADPTNYNSNEGGQLTLTFNKAYTVADVPLLDSFRTPSGLAMIRHYGLNEDAMDSASVNDPLGYFNTDFDRAGAFCMMPEALAMANGDPRFVGYLSANTFNRGFPGYVRNFNRAFLSLPAVPSIVLAGAASDATVVVRSFPTDGFGMYLAVINTARTTKSGVTITLPEQSHVTDAARNTVVSTSATTVSLTLYPYEMRTFRLQKRVSGAPVAVDDTASTNEGTLVNISVLTNDTGSTSIASVGTAANGTVTIVGTQARYTPKDGFSGVDSFRYTASNGSQQSSARVYVTVNSTSTENLFAWKVRKNSIGRYSDGRARLLSGNTVGQVIGYGEGITDDTDSCQLQGLPFSGNFQVTARINSIAGANGVAGLMVRQDWVASSRMAAVGLGADGVTRVYTRNTAGGWSYPESTSWPNTAGPVWMRLARDGDQITIAASSDNVSYTTLAVRSFTGLPPVLRVGTFLTGGTPAAPALAKLQNFTATTAAPAGETYLFEQAFDSSTVVSNYVDATNATANKFTNLSAEAEGGTWTVDGGGVLRLVAPESTSSNNDAGFIRTGALTPAATMGRVCFDVSVDGENTFGDLGYVELGQFTTVADYENPGTNASHFFRLALKGNGPGIFHFRINGATGNANGVANADGSLHSVIVYLNNTGATQAYTGPDGLAYSVDDKKFALWLDGKIAFDNAVRDTGFNAANFATFRFRSPTGKAYKVAFDHLLITNTLNTTSPGLTNTAPTATADSATTNEGVPVLVSVLANDTDTDHKPGPLAVQSITQPTKGVTAIVGNQVRYTPNPGAYGADSFSYTLTDGLATANATVSITVTNTATASNLTSVGLTGNTMGGTGGQSRIIAGGDLEVRHTATAGTSGEQHYLESASLNGNFTVQARIHEVNANASVAMLGGLMVRENTATNGRFALLGANPSHQYYMGGRTTLGGAVNLTLSTVASAWPASWVRMVRVADTLTMWVSADGIAYQQISSFQIPGLAESLRVGLFAANGRLVADEYRAAVDTGFLFQQDFSSSTSVSAYVNEIIPQANQLNHIGTFYNGGTWSIDAGRLRHVRLNSNNSGAGFVRTTPLPGSPTVLKLSTDLTLTSNTSYNDLYTIELGSFPTVGDYVSIANGNIHNRFVVKGDGTGKFILKLATSVSGQYNANGTTVHVDWFVNNSGTTKTYTGPNGTTNSLNNLSSSLWANGVLVLNNIARDPVYTGTSLSNFRMRATTTTLDTTIDNLVIDDTFLVNTAPVAVNDTATVAQNGNVLIPVLTNDTDADAAPAAKSILSVGPGANGTTVIESGQIRYTPTAGFSGSDSFTYLVTDGADVDWGTVNVTVTGASNSAPLAVNDSATVNEGVAGLVSVLANDSDPNGGPAPLSITAVGTPLHGTAVISGTQVQYTPVAGYYGPDSFSYTISDSDLTATATVNMTVTDTATAHNLSGAGLTGLAVGSGSSGSSRVLANGQWEVNGVGSTLGGTADAVYYEQKSQSGNFQAYVRLQSLTGNTTARAGLMLREGTGAGARMVLLAATPSGGVYVHGNRTTASAAATITNSSTSYTYSNTWLLIERAFGQVRLATSTDGVTYTTLTTVALSSLTSSVNIGPFVTGGDGSTSARAVLSNFQVVALPIAAINCGKPSGGEFVSLDDGTIYVSDYAPPATGGTTTPGTQYAIAGTLDDALFAAYRYGTHSYSIPNVPSGNYVVTLRFSDNATSAAVRVFDVALEGTLVLDNYDIYADVGTNTVANKTFTVAVTDGTLNIQFTNVIGQAKINAIVVKPAP
jgi:regulation of enolase protein 1 (concanavalin A-like superfamily)